MEEKNNQGLTSSSSTSVSWSALRDHAYTLMKNLGMEKEAEEFKRRVLSWNPLLEQEYALMNKELEEFKRRVLSWSSLLEQEYTLMKNLGMNNEAEEYKRKVFSLSALHQLGMGKIKNGQGLTSSSSTSESWSALHDHANAQMKNLGMQKEAEEFKRRALSWSSLLEQEYRLMKNLGMNKEADEYKRRVFCLSALHQHGYKLMKDLAMEKEAEDFINRVLSLDPLTTKFVGFDINDSVSPKDLVSRKTDDVDSDLLSTPEKRHAFYDSFCNYLKHLGMPDQVAATFKESVKVLESIVPENPTPLHTDSIGKEHRNELPSEEGIPGSTLLSTQSINSEHDRVHALISMDVNVLVPAQSISPLDSPENFGDWLGHPPQMD